MAPYLIFGFLVAGVLHVTVSPAWMRRHLGGRGIMPVVKSVLLGIPLPLCSCGVIAVTASIRKQGAGRGAAIGFLIATPQTGVDSILATWGMLGPILGIFRPLAALVTGLIGGALVALSDKGEGIEASGTAMGDASVERAPCSLSEALRYGLVDLPRDIAKPLFVGVILAGIITAAVPGDALAPYLGGGLVAMIIMTLFGIPLYVCATASIPLALSFVHLGASPGAALAFLIAGPATNTATIATVWNMMGRKATAIYLGTVAVGAILAGLVYDMAFGGHAMLHSAMDHHHEEFSGGMHLFFGVLLALLLINSLWGKRLWSKVRSMTNRRSDTREGEVREFNVQGLTCMHCAGALEKKLAEISGVQMAQVDYPSGRARVSGEGASINKAMALVGELGYRVASEP